MDALLKKARQALFGTRQARTFWQALLAYVALHASDLLDGAPDLASALKALALGALAAGISALWKPSSDDLETRGNRD